MQRDPLANGWAGCALSELPPRASAGEFRTNLQEYRLHGIEHPEGLRKEVAEDPDGLLEDEFQLLINVNV